MITLEAIKTEQTKLAKMIAAIEVAMKAARQFDIPEQNVALEIGEHYAGIIVGKDGEASYHLILLPGEADSANWAQAKEFAKRAGGDLPTRREQSLLYANLKEQFKEAWYWSGEQSASGSGYAWVQYFYDGGQDYYRKSSYYRARAVRRLPIKGETE